MRLRFKEYEVPLPPLDPDRGLISRSQTGPDELTIALPRGYNDRRELATLIALGALSEPGTPLGSSPSCTAVILKADGTLRTSDNNAVALPEELDTTVGDLLGVRKGALDSILEAFNKKGALPAEWELRFPGWQLSRRGRRP